MNDVVMFERSLPNHDGVRPAWPGEVVEDLHVRRGPSGGEPGLLVHGLGGSATNWTDLVRLLEGVGDGEAVDLPGFGHSPPPRSGRYRLGAHAPVVVAHLERRGRGPVHRVEEAVAEVRRRHALGHAQDAFTASLRG